jgi:hypothetical protein
MKTNVTRNPNQKEIEFIFQYQPNTEMDESPEFKEGIVKIQDPTWDQVAEAYKYITDENGKLDLVTPGKFIYDVCALETDAELSTNHRAMLSVCSQLAMKFVFPIGTEEVFKKLNTENSEEAIRNAIISMGEFEGVAGSMASMELTIQGRESALGDQWDAFKPNIGEAISPAYKTLLDISSNTLGLLNIAYDQNIATKIRKEKELEDLLKNKPYLNVFGLEEKTNATNTKTDLGTATQMLNAAPKTFNIYINELGRIDSPVIMNSEDEEDLQRKMANAIISALNTARIQTNN